MKNIKNNMKKRDSRSCFVNSRFIFSKSKRSIRFLNPLSNIKYFSDSKRSQITVFVIIGVLLILVIAIAGLFFVKDNQVVKEFINKNSVSSEIMPVYESIDSCFQERAIDAVRIVGLQGGYLNMPEGGFDTGSFSTAYDYNNGKNLLPKKERVENEINDYIELTVPYCELDFSYENISFDKPVSNTKINTDSVSITFTIPVTVTKSNYTYSLDKNYYSEVPVRLGSMLDISDKIIQKQIGSGEYVPVSYLTNFDYNIVFYTFNDTVVYAIIDNSSKMEEPYSFAFAAKLK